MTYHSFVLRKARKPRVARSCAKSTHIGNWQKHCFHYVLNGEMYFDAPPNSLMGSIVSTKGENNERIRSWGTLPNSQHFGGRGACWNLGMGTRKSDKQVDNLAIGPSFGHNLCFKCPNGSCEPILDIYILRTSNGIRNSSIQWVLTPTITLWKFRSPLGLQLPKWELTWECVGSFPPTFLNFQEHEMWLLGFTFGLHLYKLLPWSQA